MELCRCGSLDAFIRNGNHLSEDELREIASCSLLGLHYLHSHRIIHGVRQWRDDEWIGHQPKQSVHFGDRWNPIG